MGYSARIAKSRRVNVRRHGFVELGFVFRGPFDKVIDKNSMLAY